MSDVQLCVPTCQFCNKTFSTLSNRNKHQKTSVYCLSIQKKEAPASFLCSSCDESFTTKFNLHKHENRCTKFQDSVELIECKAIIKELRSENKRLRESLNAISCKLASRPNTVYKNYNINQLIINNELAPYTLTPERIEQIVDEKFEAKHLYLKTAGLAKFAIDNVIKAEDGKPQMVCTDTSRKTFIYRDENGHVYRDADASEFSEQYLNALEKKGSKIIDQISSHDSEAIRQTITGITKIQDLKENRGPLTGELAKKLAIKNAGVVEENP
jgi:hypothetical protein